MRANRGLYQLFFIKTKNPKYLKISYNVNYLSTNPINQLLQSKPDEFGLQLVVHVELPADWQSKGQL